MTKICKGDERKEAEKNNEAARVWISGLEAVNRKLGVARVIDLSATPFFLRGSGYAEGTLFPWTMSDFSLMDAIECGIVKLPRVPDCGQHSRQRNADVPQSLGAYPRQDAQEGPRQGRRSRPARSSAATANGARGPVRPLQARRSTLWAKNKISVPPCFIVVCNNTSTSKLVYDYISGFQRENEDGTSQLEFGRLAAFPEPRRARQPARRVPNTADRQRAAGVRRGARRQLSRDGRRRDRPLPA